MLLASMKKIFQPAVLGLVVALTVVASLLAENIKVDFTITQNAILANSTNTSVSTNDTVCVINLGNEPPFAAQFGVYGIGQSAASTNGITTFVFQVSPTGTNLWNDLNTSPFRLSITNMNGAASTNISVDWFTLGGARYIRLGRVENTVNGVVTNPAAWMQYNRTPYAR